MRWAVRITAFIYLSFCIEEYNALQCFVCTTNRLTKKDCRSLSSARLIDCPDSSDHCNAIVADIDGQVIVNRGCSGNTESWGFGNECDLMTHDKLLDRAVAFYQCRGDGCNNIEPGEITTVTQMVDDAPVQVPKFTMSSNLKSQQSLVDEENSISQSRAIMTVQEDDLMMRKGKQMNGDEDDDGYGNFIPGKKRTTTTSTTTEQPTTTEESTTTEVPVTTTTTRTTTTTTKRPTTTPTTTRTTTTTTKRTTTPVSPTTTTTTTTTEEPTAITEDSTTQETPITTTTTRTTTSTTKKPTTTPVSRTTTTTTTTEKPITTPGTLRPTRRKFTIFDRRR